MALQTGKANEKVNLRTRKSMGYNRLWVPTAMAYDSFDCKSLIFPHRTAKQVIVPAGREALTLQARTMLMRLTTNCSTASTSTSGNEERRQAWATCEWGSRLDGLAVINIGQYFVSSVQ